MPPIILHLSAERRLRMKNIIFAIILVTVALRFRDITCISDRRVVTVNSLSQRPPHTSATFDLSLITGTVTASEC